MILSKDNTHEFDVIRSPDHIEKVWAAIEATLPRYWNLFVEKESTKEPSSKLATHFSVKSSKGSTATAKAFAQAVSTYEKAATKYRDFFSDEAIEEFADDPNTFKSHLAREVPVIAGTLNQRRPELQEWQRDFRITRGKDLLEVFANVLDFRSEWTSKHPEAVYQKHDELGAFGLDPLDDDESMRVDSVVGMGIKSIVLYHLDARVFPQRARTDLYGLYFLSDMKDFGLPSHSSEFLMINDREPASNGSLIMDHNFWYPYGLFSLYALRIYRWLDKKVQSEHGALDSTVRYVYVTQFLASVCSEHTEHMKVMRAHDRFGVPA